MDKLDHYHRLKQLSSILNPRGNFGPEMEFLDLNNRNEIDNEIIRLVGTKDNPGKYYNSITHSFDLARIRSYEERIEEVRAQFSEYQRNSVNQGFRKPKDMPDDLKDKVATLEALLAVALDEYEYLKQAREKAPIPKGQQQEVRPRMAWAAGKLLDGEIVERGGFTVSKNADGIPSINDERSAHNGMEHWRFIEQIVKPMAWEYGFRKAVEKDAAKKEHRPANKPPYPEAGIWHKDSDLIEYPNYSAKALAQIKAVL